MDNASAQKLAAILERAGMLTRAQPNVMNPTVRGQQNVTVRATPPQGPNPFDVPYQGMHNEPYAPTVPTPTATVLPPFEQPGGSLPIQPYMQNAQAPAPQATPAPAMAAPPMPAPQPVAAQPTPQALALAQALQPQRQLLPEQWRGTFGNQYGEPT